MVEHRDLLAEDSAQSQRARQVLEGKITSLLQSVKADIGLERGGQSPMTMFKSLEQAFNAHAASVPTRSTWLAQQRTQARTAATAYIRLNAKGWTDGSRSRQTADELVSMAGPVWRKSVESVIKQEEAKARVAAAAEERRQAAEERREAAEQAAEERRSRADRLPAKCYEQFGPSYQRHTCAELVRSCKRGVAMGGFTSVRSCLAQGYFELYCAGCY